MMTTGETMAEAPRAVFGTLENATPRIVETTAPEINIPVKINHLDPAVGRFTPKNATPAASKSTT